MGEVFQARDEVLGEEVALKTILGRWSGHAEALQRLRREVQLTRRVSHPNVCRVHDLHSVRTHLGEPLDFLSMEFLRGQTLAARLQHSGPLSPEEVLALLLQLAAGLDAAHVEGVVHRDFKGSNIFLTERGTGGGGPLRAVITDFGIARLSVGERSDGTLGTVGTIGTPDYMAPEQVLGEPAGPAADIYALGVVLFELLTGQLPFTGDSPLQTALARLNQPPRLLHELRPGLDPRWGSVVQRCLALAPENRFPTAQTAVDVLLGRSEGSILVAAEGRLNEVVPPAQGPSVAVLRFASEAPSADSVRLAEGVSERILNALVRVRGLSVLARASSFRFGADRPEPREIGRQLGVSWLVDGTVAREGRRLRVTAQLVEAKSGFVRWADRIETSADALASVEGSVLQAVSSALGLEAPPDRPQRIADPVALEKVMQARYFWNRRPEQVAVDQALQLYREAIEADPNCAEAWAGLAEVYATLGSWEIGVLPPAEAQSKASTYAARALALDPTLAEAHAALGYSALHFGWDSLAADASFRRAIELNRNCVTAFHWYSHALTAVGRVDESLATSRAALKLDPMNVLMTAHLAWHHHMAREPGRVVDQAQRVVHMDPSYQWGYYFLSWGHEAEGRLTEAVAAAREGIRRNNNPVMNACLARAYASAGDVRDARETCSLFARDARGRDLFAFELGLVELALGDRDAALTHFERALVCRSGWIAYARADPRLDPLRAEPRFQAIAAAAPRQLITAPQTA
jgi:serine/threonine-protein kinase